jgi:adenylosuccinate synthase
MKADVLLGLQWGDEGKGKIVDFLTPDYSVISRFQGGPNAGHSLEFNDTKHVLHTIPSGIFRKDTTNIIGNGVVIDPVIFKKEIDGLKNFEMDVFKTLLISRKAHLILPSHRILDAASEAAKGKTKIGSTLKGIGPTYMDKTGRNGLRIGDIESSKFKEKYNFLVQKHKQLLKLYNYNYNIEEQEQEWFEGIELIKQFSLINSEYYLNQCLQNGKKILAEGAQGTLLDIDFGTYPYVTSSNTVTAGASIGLGIAPNRLGKVLGIFKAYCTRVGSGPFPSELRNQEGEKLRRNGHEFGSTTGRPRRCGWLDLPALKYSTMINGVTQLIMTKADVLTGFEKFKVVTAYKTKKTQSDILPFEFTSDIEPVYREFEGWQDDITKAREMNDLPSELKVYIQFIENELNLPVKIISIGPNREETIFR